MRSRLWCVCVLALAVQASWALLPKPAKCGVDGYNVKPLKKGENDDPYEAQSPKGSYRYFFNFCGHAKGCYQQPSCQVKMRDGQEDIATVTTTGELYTMLWEKLDEQDFASMSKQGAGDFTDGVKVTYKIGPKQRSSTIMVPCSEKLKKEEEGKAIGFVTEGPTLHYTAVIQSRHGCQLPLSQLPIGINPTLHGHSHGTYAVIAIVALLLYCCVGAWYKRERLGAQGIEMIPHVDTVCALVECSRGMCSSDMVNNARGVGDDGL